MHSPSVIERGCSSRAPRAEARGSIVPVWDSTRSPPRRAGCRHVAVGRDLRLGSPPLGRASIVVPAGFAAPDFSPGCHKGLLSLDLVAQDGTRVRASATAPSFRAAASLEECREQAVLHVRGVLAEADDPESSVAEHAARLAAARDYERRVDEALLVVRELRDAGKDEPRASTTDAEARVMKMPDGGYRPGYNIQMATAGSAMGGPRTIVGVLVTHVGSDMGSVTPMLDQIHQRTGALPKVLLADANHAKHECIRRCAELGVQALISVPARSAKAGPDADTDPAVCAWRKRMETDDAKRLFRARASPCELSNAHLKHHHGVAQVLVRGLAKVTCVAFLAALAANLVSHAANLIG